MTDANQNGGSENDGKTRPNSKVARVMGEYGLEELEDELVLRWTGDGDERWSLRDLAEYVNQKLLATAMLDAGMDILDGEVENFYRLLRGDDVSSGKRTEAETTLEREGVNVEQLKRDFVSHQAVHSYLTKYRGIDGPSKADGEDRVEKAVNTIQRLKNRLIAVTEKNLRTLDNTGRISIGNVNVLVDVRVFCEDCGEQYAVVELLGRGGCDCGD